MKVTKRRWWYVVAAKVEFELECGHIVEHFYRDPEKGRGSQRKKIRCKVCDADFMKRQFDFDWGKDGATTGAVDAGLDAGSSDQGIRGEK